MNKEQRKNVKEHYRDNNITSKHLNNKLRNQLDEKHHYESLANSLLRLLIAVAGSIITVVYISVIILERTNNDVPSISPDLDSLAAGIANLPLISEGASIAIIFILLLWAPTFLFLSFVYTFPLASWYALQILKPKDFKRGINPWDTTIHMNSTKPNQVERSNHTSMTYLISHNEQELEKIEKNWAECHSKIILGLLCFTLSVLASVSLYSAMPGLTVGVALFILLAIFSNTIGDSDLFDFWMLIKWESKTHNGFIVFSTVLCASLFIYEEYITNSIILLGTYTTLGFLMAYLFSVLKNANGKILYNLTLKHSLVAIFGFISITFITPGGRYVEAISISMILYGLSLSMILLILTIMAQTSSEEYPLEKYYNAIRNIRASDMKLEIKPDHNRPPSPPKKGDSGGRAGR